ncbi:putative membrane protein [Trichococcus patagoniensis]|uniref:Putative membrane protein n=1 Tax=Trichococcus patagoniensis TaxID=382641 RepID=A0A2T5ICD6_9LACT|nr:SHOCT domain-containing protein [Trichococcus patagoniensis]PTQ81421.1 putative membrane protein [Trichococcus patagoniensis]
MMNYYGYNMMGGWGIFMMIILLVILIVIIVYVVMKLVQGGNNAGTTSNGRDEALEILNQRYAKGELSDEEYQQKKKILKS